MVVLEFRLDITIKMYVLNFSTEISARNQIEHLFQPPPPPNRSIFRFHEFRSLAKRSLWMQPGYSLLFVGLRS